MPANPTPRVHALECDLGFLRRRLATYNLEVGVPQTFREAWEIVAGRCSILASLEAVSGELVDELYEIDRDAQDAEREHAAWLQRLDAAERSRENGREMLAAILGPTGARQPSPAA